MTDTNYLSRVIKHPQFVLNENFILHPLSSLSTSRKIIKNNLPLIDCVKKLTDDTAENIKKYYEDIANNSELEKHLQNQFDEYNSYINSKDLKISKFFKENPAGRLNRPSQGHAGFFLYILVRSLKPEFFLETGVSAGESSTYILQAMRDNANSSQVSRGVQGKNLSRIALLGRFPKRGIGKLGRDFLKGA